MQAVKNGPNPRHPRLDALSLSVLFGALLVGLLRFWKLGEWSLWVDEAYTYADGRLGLDSEQLWNPLGYWLLLGVADLLGDRPDEFGLRFLPALAGWCCIPLSWWAFRTWVGDRRAALVSLLLAASSWHIFWSQNARFYTLAMATSLLGAGLVLRAMAQGKRPLALLGLLVTAAAAAFHVTAVLIVPALCLGPALALLRGSPLSRAGQHVWRLLMLLLVIASVASAPFLWSALEHHWEQKGTSGAMQGPLHLVKTLGYFYTPLVGAAAVVGAIWSWSRSDSAGLLIVAVSLVVLGCTLLISTQVLMTAQYTLCLLPWVLLLAVMPLDRWPAGEPVGARIYAAVGFVLVAPALAGSLLYFTSRGGERPRWRDAYAYVDEHREPGDLILGMGSSVGEFYLGADRPDPRSPRTVSPLGDWHPDGPRRWNRHDRRIWVVIRPQWFESFFGETDEQTLRTWLASDCRLVETFPVLMDGRDLELRVYLRE